MNIDLSGKNSRNLYVLKKIDSSIQEIICEASHIAVYEFDTSSQSWKRFNVEGATFIVKRLAQGEFSYLLIVLNKLGTDNLLLNLEVNRIKLSYTYIT